jgi:hypothetical protein
MESQMKELYRHTQFALAIVASVDIAMLVSLYLFLTTRMLPALFLGVFFFIATCLFYALTVIGTRDALEIRFGIGLIRKRFKIKGIAAVRPYRTSFWHGWGIHNCSDGLIFNATGFDAVHLTMANGKKYIIGTNDGTRLINFIEEYRRS